MRVRGYTLHRIRAVRDFGDVKKGDIGGWIESEKNLSHEGNCWVTGDSKVYGARAKVHGNTVVTGDPEDQALFTRLCLSSDVPSGALGPGASLGLHHLEFGPCYR